MGSTNVPWYHSRQQRLHDLIYLRTWQIKALAIRFQHHAMETWRVSKLCPSRFYIMLSDEEYISPARIVRSKTSLQSCGMWWLVKLRLHVSSDGTLSCDSPLLLREIMLVGQINLVTALYIYVKVCYNTTRFFLPCQTRRIRKFCLSYIWINIMCRSIDSANIESDRTSKRRRLNSKREHRPSIRRRR
jgi:hypothetical protein